MKANANGDGMDEDGEGPKIKYRKIKYSLPHFMQLLPPTLLSLCPCHLPWLVAMWPLVLHHLSFSSCPCLPSGSASTCPPLIALLPLVVSPFFFGALTSCPPWHDKAMHNDQSSSSSMDTLSGKRSRSSSRSPYCSSSRSCSCLSSSGRSYTNYHVSHDGRKSSRSLKRKYLYSEDDNDRHYHCPDKSDTVLSPLLLQQQRSTSVPPK